MRLCEEMMSMPSSQHTLFDRLCGTCDETTCRLMPAPFNLSMPELQNAYTPDLNLIAMLARTLQLTSSS